MERRCIFCKTVEGEFNTKEHILPESLGGGEWALLSKALVCDKCQNIFGSTVEQQALGDYPFSHIRAFMGIPTKKGKAPWFNSWEGKIIASPFPGMVAYEPSKIFKDAMESGKKTQIRLLAHPIKPYMVCRFLIKMGLEVLAEKDAKHIFKKKFDNAREYALKGVKRGKWWYIEHDDLPKWNLYITNGITEGEWSDNVELGIVHVGEGAEAFYFRFLFVCFIVPLEQRIIAPPIESLPEPIYRLFVV
jgi:hypothetical protein